MTAFRDGEDRGRQGRRRTNWFDPRFAIGMVLVVVSVLGVVGLVGAANASVDVLAARTALTPGERVHTGDLVATSIRVGPTAGLYLRANQVPRAGVIVTRAIAAGELVPQSAVGSEAGSGLTSVVITVPGSLAASVASGSRVDLWCANAASAGGESADGESADGESSDAAETGGTGAFAPPTVLVSSALVVRLVDSKGVVASSGSSVELLIPKDDTASVLDALANGAILSVVPVDLPLGN